MTDVAWIIFVDPGAILYGILGGSIVFLFLESIKQIGRIVYRRWYR